MNWPDTQQLVRETIELTGAAPPELLDENAPVLADSVLADTALAESVPVGDGIVIHRDAMYLVGLIGGKEVGKSALVNAIAGAQITEQTSHGPGTQIVIAYAHHDRAAALRELLEKQVPGKYRLVQHENQRLSRQVLLDLPDIDSRFAEHLEIVRRMLRHMLFPIWIQSVEKYADAQPQVLLGKVAAGNDPTNFLFCLNKADQLPAGDGSAEQLRNDYASRMAKVLSLSAPPRVYMISAIHPLTLDFPELSRLLSQEKSTQSLSQSRELASRQRQRSALAWLTAQNLAERAARMARVEEQASELLSERLGVPLVENVVPAVLDDAAYRMVMTDGVFARRVARWPIVAVIHSLLSPLRLLIRENAAPGTFFGGAAALIDSHLTRQKNPLANLLQSAFAQLHQSNPAIAGLYQQRKLWESADAAAAESRLRDEWIDTINRQRQTLMSRLHGRAGFIAPIFRVLLTIGALLWFPFVQPILDVFLQPNSLVHSLRDLPLVLVEVFSAAALLKSAVFLAIWYLIIYGLLRWDTRRRVDRLLSRWKTARNTDPDLNLTTSALRWIDDLLQPIVAEREQTENLAMRVQTLQNELASAK
jgi:GTPase Era involved in 16S rRNA processing